MKHLNLVLVILCLLPHPSLMADSVSSLVQELSSSDVNARREAIGKLLTIAYQTMPVLAHSKTSTSDLTAPSVQNALIVATSDSDFAVRQAALETYALTYNLTPELEDKIIAEFNSPELELPHQPSDKTALIEILMIGRSPSPVAIKFLTDKLDDPKYDSYVAERIRADRCPISGEALDKLVIKLNQEKDPGKRANFAGAIGSYGKLARHYTPQLQAALANEKNEITKANIKAAIDKANQ